ncbi:MarC family protein [Aridibaculum aurantiacum]|uniref:MarC family protein n=1 Tax=Aridibaculum aurantiacum TaxID=2810307 RepID=UPI001A961D80|nr:MarC family protein [Aridibaculum aurantiacum]
MAVSLLSDVEEKEVIILQFSFTFHDSINQMHVLVMFLFLSTSCLTQVRLLQREYKTYWMISAIVSFLVMLNPFALFLYLKPVMKDLSDQDFVRVFLKATIISFFIFLAFLFFGDIFFLQVFRINFESFRIFGGIVIFSLAYLFIVRGEKAFIQMKGDLHDLASEIALPFMVGAGTISLTVLMRDRLVLWQGIVALVIILLITFFVIIGMKKIRDGIKSEKFRLAFDKNMEVLLRINGFFLGAIGVDMIVHGIRSSFSGM